MIRLIKIIECCLNTKAKYQGTQFHIEENSNEQEHPKYFD